MTPRRSRFFTWEDHSLSVLRSLHSELDRHKERRRAMISEKALAELSYPEAPLMVTNSFPGPKAQQLVARAAKVQTPTRMAAIKPVAWEEARGATLKDVDGKFGKGHLAAAPRAMPWAACNRSAAVGLGLDEGVGRLGASSGPKNRSSHSRQIRCRAGSKTPADTSSSMHTPGNTVTSLPPRRAMGRRLFSPRGGISATRIKPSLEGRPRWPQRLVQIAASPTH